MPYLLQLQGEIASGFILDPPGLSVYKISRALEYGEYAGVVVEINSLEVSTRLVDMCMTQKNLGAARQ